MNFSIATPAAYQPQPDVVDCARSAAAVSGGSFEIVASAEEAVAGAAAVYTDVWASMGQEAEAEKRRRDFAPFQVNEKLFALARPDAISALPAGQARGRSHRRCHRSPRSIVFDQRKIGCTCRRRSC